MSFISKINGGELLGSGKILIFIALLIAGGLTLYYFQTSQDVGRQSRVKSEINTDSIPAPKRPVFTNQPDAPDTATGDTLTSDAVVDLAPGTALIRGMIRSVGYSGDLPDTIRVQVNEVRGYGPATPLLSVGADLTLAVSDYLKAHPETKDRIENQGEIRALVSFKQEMRRGESAEKQHWTLIEVQ